MSFLWVKLSIKKISCTFLVFLFTLSFKNIFFSERRLHYCDPPQLRDHYWGYSRKYSLSHRKLTPHALRTVIQALLALDNKWFLFQYLYWSCICKPHCQFPSCLWSELCPELVKEVWSWRQPHLVHLGFWRGLAPGSTAGDEWTGGERGQGISSLSLALAQWLYPSHGAELSLGLKMLLLPLAQYPSTGDGFLGLVSGRLTVSYWFPYSYTELWNHTFFHSVFFTIPMKVSPADGTLSSKGFKSLPIIDLATVRLSPKRWTLILKFSLFFKSSSEF